MLSKRENSTSDPRELLGEVECALFEGRLVTFGKALNDSKLMDGNKDDEEIAGLTEIVAGREEKF